MHHLLLTHLAFNCFLKINKFKEKDFAPVNPPLLLIQSRDHHTMQQDQEVKYKNRYVILR